MSGRLPRRLLGGRLWHHHEFLKLWSGQGLSQVGTQVTLIALPTTAITILHATPAELGLLAALGYLSYPAFGLVAGVWADRLRRRHLLIACDLMRFAALMSVPLGYASGVLSLAMLYAVSVVVGAASTFFDAAYQAYLPTLIDRADLLEGNSKLEASRSTAAILGPAGSGLLIQLVTAAWAIALDALSYVISVLTLLWIRSPEAPMAADGRRRSFRAELGEGVRHLFAQPVLRLILACTATLNLGTGMAISLFLLFAYGDLGMTPGVVGVIFALGSVGTLLGAVSARALSRHLRLGTVLLLSAVATGLGNLLIPLAGLGAPVLVLLASTVLVGMFSTIYNINHLSLRQTVVPDHLLGRISATWRTIAWGTAGLGALVGGSLGSAIGLVPALGAAAGVSMAAALWLSSPSVRSWTFTPAPASTSETAA